MNFNERVKKARAYAGLTQAQVAEAAGVDQRTVDRAENRKEGKGSTATVQIARACKVSPYWLATDRGEMELHAQAELSEESLLSALAVEHLPTHLRDQYLKELLVVAINFIATTHPSYKRIAALYRKAQKRDNVRQELKGKTRSGG